MPEVRVNDARIAWQAEGPTSGPVLMLSNSLGTSMNLWAPQIATLSRHFRIVRYDTRGHGRSTAPARDYSIDELGRDAIAVLDAAGVDRAHVCGISLGGLTAMWLGIHAADRVGSFVLANTSSRVGTKDMWEQRIQQVRTVGMVSIADLLMPRWFSDAFRASSLQIVADFRSMVASCDPNGYAGCCAALRDADLRPLLARITALSLVIVGRHDPSTPPADGEAIRNAIPGARLVALDSAHLSNVECAAAFSNYVLSFLQGRLDG